MGHYTITNSGGALQSVKRWCLGEYIPEHRLPVLKEYKYKGVDDSIMSQMVLRHWWEWFVQLLPDWMAPNMVTLIGFTFSFSGFLAVLCSSAGMTQACSSVVQLYIAFVLFAYMTFDAVDGKQARRTGTSSPLGQLFDHGCDAVNLIFTVFMTWAAFDMRPSMAMAINGVFCYLVFLTSTWEEHHTHILNLGVINGPVEGSLMVSVAALASAVFGTGFWHRSVPFLEVEWNNVLYVVIGCGSVFTMTMSLKECIRRKGLVAILPSYLSTILPQYLVLLWFGMTPKLWDTRGLVLFLIYSGFCATNSIFAIIIATVTKAPFPHWNHSHWTIVGGFGVRLIGRVWGPVVDDHQLMTGCMWMAAALNAHFAFSVIDQLCRYLDIYCLRIKPPSRKQ